MNNLKLEVGKAYKSVYGKKAVVLHEESYGFLVDYGDNAVNWHRHEDGGRSNIVDDFPEFSLVSEWVEEPKVTHKFKVGDRVVGNSNHLVEHRKGDTGIVDSVCDDLDLWITWDSDSRHHYCRPDEVTLIEEKPVVDLSNPNKKTWSEMTPEEKGALLLAAHEGKGVESSYGGERWNDTYAIGQGNLVYRVKPSPVADQVILFSNSGLMFGVIMTRDSAYKITYQTVDGEPDWSTIKGETL